MMSLHDRVDILVNYILNITKLLMISPNCYDITQLLLLTIIVSSSKHYTIVITGKYNIKFNRQNQLNAHPYYMLMWSLWCQSMVFNLYQVVPSCGLLAFTSIFCSSSFCFCCLANRDFRLPATMTFNFEYGASSLWKQINNNTLYTHVHHMANWRLDHWAKVSEWTLNVLIE